MINYIFDGSFEGLLSSIYEAFYRHETPNNILTRLPLQESLIDNNIVIQTDSEKAIKVNNSIREKISQLTLEKIYYSYLSELEFAATWIYEYIKLGFKTGPNVDLNLSDDRVLRVHKLSAKVTKETHLMLGLIRFKLLEENLYYAQMEPDYNILELIAPHFADRMADQNWVIHDVKRGVAAMYNQIEWVITDANTIQLPSFGEKELYFQNLWKQYFKSISIANRVNPKLQRKIMPARYWKHLLEK
jgi:probable DNA metabolism protein